MRRANAQPEVVECEPPAEGSEGKPPPTAEGGGEPLSYGEVEGIHFNVISFHSTKVNGRATQRRQRKAAPRKGGGGRQHHQKEEGIAAMGRKHHRPKGGGEGEVLRFFLVALPSFSSPGVGVLFSSLLLGGAAGPPPAFGRAAFLSSFGWFCFPEISTSPKRAGEKAP